MFSGYFFWCEFVQFVNPLYLVGWLRPLHRSAVQLQILVTLPLLSLSLMQNHMLLLNNGVDNNNIIKGIGGCQEVASWTQ